MSILVFTSSDIDKIPIKFMDSFLTLPSYVTMSNPRLKIHNSSDFITLDNYRSSARVRRSTDETIRTVRRDVGNLTNAIATGRSGAPISLNVKSV